MLTSTEAKKMLCLPHCEMRTISIHASAQGAMGQKQNQVTEDELYREV